MGAPTDKYKEMNEEELFAKILALKQRWGKELCILGHYYQRDEVIRFADFQGDSYALAKAGSETGARYIVFCGVYFMAEASVILAAKDQRVFLPDMDAGCPLADFATIDQVEVAWNHFEKMGIADRLIPITYMNSSAAIKAFCGLRGGLVCTSSSAGRAFDWAFSKGRRIFFLPDENLGKNTAAAKGISPKEVSVFDPLTFERVPGSFAGSSAKVIVWRGHCHVHTLFTPEHIAVAKRNYPECRVIVHPECSPEVVALSDGNGSTAYLKKYVEDAPDGSTVVVGTEINMVARLARENSGKKVVPLARSLCPNMFKISPADLCFTLANLGKSNEIFVDENVKVGASLALGRMLAL